jgi:hypothetical protein
MLDSSSKMVVTAEDGRMKQVVLVAMMCAVCRGAERVDDVQILRDCITAVSDRKHPQKYRAVLAESRALLKALDGTDRSAEQHKTLADLLARFKPLVAKHPTRRRHRRYLRARRQTRRRHA